MRPILFCLLLFFTVVPTSAQQFRTTIPYRLVEGKMLVDVKVNGLERAFVFDTGGQMTLTETLCEELGLPVGDSVRVADANGQKVALARVVIPELMMPDGQIRFTGVPAMKMTGEPFECFGAEGLIGSDLLKNFIVEIDGKAKTITISSSSEAVGVSLRKMLPFAVNHFMPVISLQAGAGNGLNVLFDTGFSGFMSLKNSDFVDLKSVGVLEVKSEGVGVGSIGVGGFVESVVSHRVEFPLLSIGSTEFKRVSSITGTPPYTLLGVKLLDYGKVTIDYVRCRFYFEAYKEEIKMNEKHYDVNLRVKDGELVVATVWSAMRGIVEPGDRILKINGQLTGTYDFCDSIIQGIPALKEKKKTKLTVATKDGEKVIVYEKK